MCWNESTGKTEISPHDPHVSCLASFQKRREMHASSTSVNYCWLAREVKTRISPTELLTSVFHSCQLGVKCVLHSLLCTCVDLQTRRKQKFHLVSCETNVCSLPKKEWNTCFIHCSLVVETWNALKHKIHLLSVKPVLLFSEIGVKALLRFLISMKKSCKHKVHLVRSEKIGSLPNLHEVHSSFTSLYLGWLKNKGENTTFNSFPAKSVSCRIFTAECNIGLHSLPHTSFYLNTWRKHNFQTGFCTIQQLCERHISFKPVDFRSLEIMLERGFVPGPWKKCFCRDSKTARYACFLHLFVLGLNSKGENTGFP